MLKENFFKLGQLISVYGDILSKKQYCYLKYYYNDNYTIDEIGEHEGVSRQSVYDVMVRGLKKLEGLEEKLRVVKMRNILENLKKKDKKIKEFINKRLQDAE